MSYKCWLRDCGSEDDATVIEDDWSAEDAAASACERWHEQGAWSGDPIPHSVPVQVRDTNGELWLVEVEPSYDVSFCAYGSKRPQPLANIENLEQFMATDETWGPKLIRFSALMGMKWEVMTGDERHERYALREELERAGFYPGWRPPT